MAQKGIGYGCQMSPACFLWLQCGQLLKKLIFQAGSGGEDAYILEKGSETNLWSVKDNALRDLLIYLVR